MSKALSLNISPSFRFPVIQAYGENIKTLIRMHGIIHISFLFIANFASAFTNCTFVPKGKIPVCGSDGKTYKNIHYFWCAQKEQYGIRVNLQLKRRWRCFIWESYGIDDMIMENDFPYKIDVM